MAPGRIEAEARRAAALALAEGPAGAARAAIAVAEAAVAEARRDPGLSAKLDALACRAGCAWCCYQMVGVTPAEASLVAEGLAALAPAVRADIATHAATAARRGEGLDQRGWTLRRLACPLLDGDGRCLVHAHRPLPCRGYNSADADICRRALDGEAVRIPVLAAPWTAFAEAQAGLAGALADAGCDPGPVTLVAALRR